MAADHDDLVQRHQELSWVSIHDASDSELRWMAWADDALAEMKRLEALLREANDAFDECAGDYAKELVEDEDWRQYGAALAALSASPKEATDGR